MWNNIEKGFKIAFETAWNSYKANNVPIGASIVDEDSCVVAIGQNQCRTSGNGILSYHQLAHAEANAILQLSEETEPNQHPNIRKYTLYTVMEPCPFCFGAIVMGSIRHVKYAARDGWAGATALNTSIDYIKNKKILVQGPFDELEMIQIAIQSCHEIENRNNYKSLLDNWNTYCPRGVTLGFKLAEEKVLINAKNENVPFEKVFDMMISEI